MLATALSHALADPEPVEISPGEASPGQTVLVRVEKGRFEDRDRVGVVFGVDPGVVVQIVDRRTLEVMVPRMAPGEVRVTVTYRGEPIAEGSVTILPSPMKRLFFQMEGDSVVLSRVRPYSGEFDPSAATGRRLSYDVLSSAGELIYTGAIPHPATQTFEVFGPDDRSSPRRVRAREPYSFLLKVPYEPGDLVVRLFDVAPGIDLSTEDGRALRRAIAEFKVPEGP